MQGVQISPFVTVSIATFRHHFHKRANDTHSNLFRQGKEVLVCQMVAFSKKVLYLVFNRWASRDTNRACPTP